MNDRCKRCDAPAVWHGKVYDNKFFEDVSYPLCEKCKAEAETLAKILGEGFATVSKKREFD